MHALKKGHTTAPLLRYNARRVKWPSKRVGEERPLMKPRVSTKISNGRFAPAISLVGLIFLVACAGGEEGSGPEELPQGIVLYETVQGNNSGQKMGLAFDESQRIFWEYDPPFNAERGGAFDFNSHLFEIRERGEVTYVTGTDMSLPKEFPTPNSWALDGRKCSASGGIFGVYDISCEGGGSTIEYRYSRERGILSFDGYCWPDDKCRFELVSTKGVFFDKPAS